MHDCTCISRRRVSLTCQYYVKMAKRSIIQTMPRDTPGTVIF